MAALNWKDELKDGEAVNVFHIEGNPENPLSPPPSSSTASLLKYVKETQDLFRLEGRSLHASIDGLLDKETFQRCLARTDLGMK